MKNERRVSKTHLVSKAAGAGHGTDDLSDAKHMGHDDIGHEIDTGGQLGIAPKSSELGAMHQVASAG
jgi:hypothetical protein